MGENEIVSEIKKLHNISKKMSNDHTSVNRYLL